MSRKKNTDAVEAMLRHADRTLDDWFRQSRMTTQQASAAFERFLGRARRDGAGALRQQVDSLKNGLGRLSATLKEMEHEPASRKPSRVTHRRTEPVKRAASRRKPRKAA